MKQSSSITFHNAGVKFSLKQKKKLKQFITHIVTSSHRHTCPSGRRVVTLSFVFCSDEYLRNINKQFLRHDYYTDILTFPLSEDKKHIEAEIYISIDRVKENSEKFKVQSSKFQNTKYEIEQSFQAELYRVMFHGVLHLLGFKDKANLQKAEMRHLEDKWLKKFEEQSSKIKKKDM